MPSIVCDEEEVTFTGDIPASPSQVYEMLMGAVSEQGRAVVKFIVDGKIRLNRGNFRMLTMKLRHSLSHDELTMRLVIEAMNQLTQTEPQLIRIFTILSVAWSEVFKQMDEFISVKPFAELIDNLVLMSRHILHWW